MTSPDAHTVLRYPVPLLIDIMPQNRRRTRTPSESETEGEDNTQAHNAHPQSQTLSRMILRNVKALTRRFLLAALQLLEDQPPKKKRKGKGRARSEGSSRAPGSLPLTPTALDKTMSSLKTEGKGTASQLPASKMVAPRKAVDSSRYHHPSSSRRGPARAHPENSSTKNYKADEGSHITFAPHSTVEPIKADESGVYLITTKAMVSAMKFTRGAFNGLFERSDVFERVQEKIEVSAAGTYFVGVRDGEQQEKGKWQEWLQGSTPEQIAQESFNIGVERGRAEANADWEKVLNAQSMDAELKKLLLSSPIVQAKLKSAVAGLAQGSTANDQQPRTRLEILTDPAPLTEEELNALLARKEVRNNKSFVVQVLDIGADVRDHESPMVEEEVDHVAPSPEMENVPANSDKVTRGVERKPRGQRLNKSPYGKRPAKLHDSSRFLPGDHSALVSRGGPSAAKPTPKHIVTAQAAIGERSAPLLDGNHTAQSSSSGWNVLPKPRVPLGPLQPNARKPGSASDSWGKAASATSLRQGRFRLKPYDRADPARLRRGAGGNKG